MSLFISQRESSVFAKPVYIINAAQSHQSNLAPFDIFLWASEQVVMFSFHCCSVMA